MGTPHEFATKMAVSSSSSSVPMDTQSPEDPLKRKANEELITEDMTPSKRAKVRAFYMEETYGKSLALPFSAEVRTKIVCTIGPASANEEMIRALLESGGSVFRFNFSHGKHEWFANIFAMIRSVAADMGRAVAIMLDTKGPEVRTCGLAGGEKVMLRKDTTFTLHTDPTIDGDDTRVATTYRGLPKSVEVGDFVLIDDGLIRLQVTEVHDDRVVTRVLNDGELGERKGVNLPGKEYDLPAVTEKDKADIAFGVQQDVDIIAASFIRSGANVRDLPGVREKGIHIVSKIESAEGVANLEEIIAESDGIMVARGDLGVEIPIEKVPGTQKKLMRLCNEAGKPVITATQMRDSMIRNPRPTRAEATDVANAVYDGTDCVMLSGETASGVYPIEAVQVMARICAEAESELSFQELYGKVRAVSLKASPTLTQAEAIASSAVKTAHDIGAKLIVALTESGNTARLISKYFYGGVIMAVTDVQKTAAQLLLTRSVTPIFIKRKIEVNDDILRLGLVSALEMGIIDSGDAVVVVSGTLAGQSGGTNTVRSLIVP